MNNYQYLTAAPELNMQEIHCLISQNMLHFFARLRNRKPTMLCISMARAPDDAGIMQMYRAIATADVQITHGKENYFECVRIQGPAAPLPEIAIWTLFTTTCDAIHASFPFVDPVAVPVPGWTPMPSTGEAVSIGRTQTAPSQEQSEPATRTPVFTEVSTSVPVANMDRTSQPRSHQ